MSIRHIRQFFTGTFKLYGQAFVQQNSRGDLLTKFIRGIAPIFLATYFYTTSRDNLPQNDPNLLLYYDLEIDKQNTPNYSQQKLKQWQNYSLWKQRRRKDVN